MKKPTEKHVAFVVDTGEVHIRKLKHFTEDVFLAERFWETNPKTLKVDRNKPIFSFVAPDVILDYFSIGLIFKCGFNTIFIKTQRDTKTFCTSSRFKKGDKFGDRTFFLDYMSYGYPIRRSTFIDALENKFQEEDFRRMKGEANAFEQGKIIVGKDDFFDQELLKKQKPIMIYERNIKRIVSEIEKVYKEFFTLLDKEDVERQKRLYPNPDDWIKIAKRYSYNRKYRDSFKELVQKYQKMYDKKMAKKHKIPMF